MNKVFKEIAQTHTLFIFIALFFGLIFVFLIPPNWGRCEDLHFDRAYQISTGKLEETKLNSVSYGGKLPANIVILNNYVKVDLLDNVSSKTKEVDSVQMYHHLESAKLSGKTETRDFSGSGSYPPVAYLAPALGIVAARLIDPTVGSVLLGARIATLLTYVTMVAGSLYLLRKNNIKWLIFDVALLPMALFQASVVSVD